jgi:hypothetical protein
MARRCRLFESASLGVVGSGRRRGLIHHADLIVGTQEEEERGSGRCQSSGSKDASRQESVQPVSTAKGE